MNEPEKSLTIVGSAEPVLLPEITSRTAYARIDTGARTSAIWGEAEVLPDGHLRVVFFGDSNIVQTYEKFTQIVVSTSTGQKQKRFAVRLLVELGGRKIRAKFSIANRETQVYPVLIGRNILRNHFIVNVRLNNGLVSLEEERVKNLQDSLLINSNGDDRS